MWVGRSGVCAVLGHPRERGNPAPRMVHLTSAADWQTINDLRATFPSADLVGNCTVFNIGGNNFRLIARFFYRSHKVYVLRW